MAPLTNLFKPKFDEKSFSSFISETMCVNGDITFAGVLRVDGKVFGTLKSTAETNQEHGIVLEKTGMIKAEDLETDFLVIDGVFDVRNVQVKKLLHIKSGAQIINCKFSCGTLKIDEGANISACLFDKLPNITEL